MNSRKIRSVITIMNPNAIIWDGYDDAILGIVENHKTSMVILYDSEEIIKILIRDKNMTEERAYAFFNSDILARAPESGDAPMYLMYKS